MILRSAFMAAMFALAITGALFFLAFIAERFDAMMAVSLVAR
jgi:hypothetical protein